MEETMLDDDMKLIRSDPQLLTRICEQLASENAVMDHALQSQRETHTLQHPDRPTYENAVSNVEPQDEDEEEFYDENVIEVNRKYNTMRDVRLAAIEYGRRRKFAVSTLRSGARQLVLACKHSGRYRGTKTTVEEDPLSAMVDDLPSVALQEKEEASPTTTDETDDSQTAAKRTRKKVSRKIQCPFQIRAKPVKGEWVVYKMDLEHNHPMAADSNAYAQHRKLNAETQKKIVKLMREGLTNSLIVKRLNAEGILNVVRKDIANLRQSFFNPNSKGSASAGNIPSQQTQDSNGTNAVEQHIQTEDQRPETQYTGSSVPAETNESNGRIHQSEQTKPDVPVPAGNDLDVIHQHIQQLEQLQREHQKLHQENSEQEAH